MPGLEFLAEWADF